MTQTTQTTPTNVSTQQPNPNQILNLILRLKPCAVLILLKDSTQTWYPSKLAKNAGSTYVHTTKLLTKFQKTGLVKFEPKGRTKTILLTEKGVIVARLLEDITEKMAVSPTPLPPQTPNQEEKKPPEDRAIV